MSLTPGTRLGPYELLALIGAGGMGEVYRARDTRLDRTVAIKVLATGAADRLPPEAPGSAEARSRVERLRDRFDREARVVSRLNHPHICTLHDIGREGGVDFLVMEYVEGESLAARLTRGPLPLAQAVRAAAEIADALARAHAAGVVHRDLKPANIMLARSGVKLLDFGIAKVLGLDDVAQAETRTASPALTTEGTILGTIQYMAPEQLEGKLLDARTDLFAFGAVMYEMITGRPAFRADTSAGLTAAILNSIPAPPATLQPLTPPALDRLIMTCLAKTPDDRWQSSQDLLRELRWMADSGAGTTAVARAVRPTRAWRVRQWTVVAALLAGGGFVGAGVMYWRTAPGGPPATTAVRFPINLASGDVLAIVDGMNAGASLDLSPDGSKIAYVVVRNGRSQLMLRHLDRLDAVVLPGTEGARAPFFSPDGEWIGFLALEKVKKIAIAGGGPLVLATVPPVCRGASWASDGTIYLVPTFSDPIFRIPDSGGPLTQVTTLEPGEANHLFPNVLPDGRSVIFTVWKGGSFADASLWVWSAATGTRRKLLDSASAGRYVSTGHVVFVRNDALLSVPFDLETLALTGAPVPVAVDAEINPTNGTAQFSVSSGGALAYAARSTAAGGADLVWVDRSGNEQRVKDLHRSFDVARLSPDGRRVAISSLNDIWINELGTSALQRLTFTGVNQFPVWTPDGARIAFSYPPVGKPTMLYWVPTDGGGQAEPMTAPGHVDFPSDWSPDGRHLAFGRTNHDPAVPANWDILAWDRETRQTSFVERTTFNEFQPAFSPDGKWLAYVSDASGRLDVYVRPYPGEGARIQISPDGGTEPRWGPDGREIFYFKGRAFMRVAIGTTPKLSASKAQTLFDGPYLHEIGSPGFANYSVSRDGQRFLMLKATDSAAGPTSLTVVLGGPDAWRQR